MPGSVSKRRSGIHRVRGSSLRWRLTTWVAGVLLISWALMFIIVYRDTGARLRSDVDRDTTAKIVQFREALRPLAGRSAADVATAAGRYVHGLPFRSASALLFALVPGVGTVSNHPDLFSHARPDGRESVATQNRENELASAILAPHPGFRTRRDADVGTVRILERRVQVGKLSLVLGAGEPLAAVTQSEQSIKRAFLLAGGLMLAIALVASYLAGARVSAPLRRMATVAARVDAGELEPRMAPTRTGSDEVRVLAEAFNHMLDRLADAFQSQREFIADASHELRTPLTVIRGQLEVLAAQESPPGAEVRRVEGLVQAEVARISRLVDDLLLLAQSERTDFLRPQAIELSDFTEQLWDGLSLTAGRRFELGDVPAGTLRADPDRLAQALRNLARNAIEHTSAPDGLVRLEVSPTSQGTVGFSVIDDGPGIPADETERVFERFHRADPSHARAGGAGLGLAIVRAIAEAHGGRAYVSQSAARGRASASAERSTTAARGATAERSPAAVRGPAGRGARLELELPGFSAAQEAAPTRARRPSRGHPPAAPA